MPLRRVIGAESHSDVVPRLRRETPAFDLLIIGVYHRLQEQTKTADRLFRCSGNDCCNTIRFSCCQALFYFIFQVNQL